ncbi:MAG: hypothetical protein JST84_33040 [Acidobacteria bacterium]|nr:hypothetical protein [Acidobacteriota bacterium]
MKKQLLLYSFLILLSGGIIQLCFFIRFANQALQNSALASEQRQSSFWAYQSDFWFWLNVSALGLWLLSNIYLWLRNKAIPLGVTFLYYASFALYFSIVVRTDYHTFTRKTGLWKGGSDIGGVVAIVGCGVLACFFAINYAIVVGVRHHYDKRKQKM